MRKLNRIIYFEVKHMHQSTKYVGIGKRLWATLARCGSVQVSKPNVQLLTKALQVDGCCAQPLLLSNHLDLQRTILSYLIRHMASIFARHPPSNQRRPENIAFHIPTLVRGASTIIAFRRFRGDIFIRLYPSKTSCTKTSLHFVNIPTHAT